MRKDADRYEDGEGDYDYDAAPELAAAGDPNAYWRRRFFILGGGIAIVGLCVWLFPGGHPSTPRAAATARASMAALDRQQQLPAAAYGSTWPGPAPKKTATPTPAATPSRTAERKAPIRAYPTGRPSPSSPSASASAAAKGPRCTASDIVLSLFTGQPSYGRGTSPTFDVYAVSTSAAACTLSYGPGSVQVVVTSHGRVVWDSAACKPTAAAPVRFTLGVPQVLSITWNRKASGPSGCAGTLPAAATGTFDAVALTDGQSSPVRSFKLTG